MTGRVPRPQPRSSGLCEHPPPRRHESHSLNVTSYIPTASGFAMRTRCTGPSSSSRPSSPDGLPIRKLPDGTTTISGHPGQSRNRRPGAFSLLSRSRACASARRCASRCSECILTDRIPLPCAESPPVRTAYAEANRVAMTSGRIPFQPAGSLPEPTPGHPPVYGKPRLRNTMKCGAQHRERSPVLARERTFPSGRTFRPGPSGGKRLPRFPGRIGPCARHRVEPPPLVPPASGLPDPNASGYRHAFWQSSALPLCLLPPNRVRDAS